MSSTSLAEQNDAFRQACATPAPLNGKYVHTAGIEALGLEVILDLWRGVRDFTFFNENSDPHSDHDFGSIEHPRAGKVFWKIDYYDLAYAQGSEDPTDPEQTRRVLTVMLASEY